ncbi:MAG: nucleotidyltransferase family protein [Bacteroidales bacterium]|jgi:predicted nucleotidyltransferase
MTTKGEILDFLTRNKQYFRDQFGIVKIGLFGSYAKDEQTDGSDIDLIVEFANNTPNLFDVKNELKNYINERFNIQVDIAREKYLKPIYRDSILQETIYV